MRISVIGGSTVDDATETVAEAVGRRIAARGHVVVCGGLGGVMEAACRGASAAGGETIGILPGTDRTAANPYVQTPIVTGLGDARNLLVVLNGEGVIAINGANGTLSEIGFAAIADRPIAGLDTFELPAIEPVATPDAAVDFLERTLT